MEEKKGREEKTSDTKNIILFNNFSENFILSKKMIGFSYFRSKKVNCPFSLKLKVFGNKLKIVEFISSYKHNNITAEDVSEKSDKVCLQVKSKLSK